MNRRGFIAGLLASSAAVPIVSAFAADMGAGAADLYGGPAAGDMADAVAYAWHRHSVGYAVSNRLFFAGTADGVVKVDPAIEDFTRWGPDPGTIWFDEAATFEQWQVDLLLAWQKLDAQPVPADSKLLWPALDDLPAVMLSLDQAQEANHDRLDDPGEGGAVRPRP